jgi:hypothetical protein
LRKGQRLEAGDRHAAQRTALLRERVHRGRREAGPAGRLDRSQVAPVGHVHADRFDDGGREVAHQRCDAAQLVHVVDVVDVVVPV